MSLKRERQWYVDRRLKPHERGSVGKKDGGLGKGGSYDVRGRFSDFTVPSTLLKDPNELYYFIMIYYDLH